jgi:hypothetical protein
MGIGRSYKTISKFGKNCRFGLDGLIMTRRTTHLVRFAK